MQKNVISSIKANFKPSMRNFQADNNAYAHAEINDVTMSIAPTTGVKSIDANYNRYPRLIFLARRAIF